MLRHTLSWAVGLVVALVGAASLAGERPLSETIRAAADAVRPAVVGIEVKGRRAGNPREMPNFPFGASTSSCHVMANPLPFRSATTASSFPGCSSTSPPKARAS